MWHCDVRGKLKRKWKFKNGVLKTRCPSYCLRCLRVIPPLVVGLANWLSTPWLPVFRVQFQEESAFVSYRSGKRAFSNSVSRCFSFSAHLSSILNFNTPLLEFFTVSILYEKHHKKRIDNVLILISSEMSYLFTINKWIVQVQSSNRRKIFFIHYFENFNFINQLANTQDWFLKGIIVSLVKHESSFPSSKSQKVEELYWNVRTRANAASSILRNSRISPAHNHLDLVISGSLKCSSSGNDREAASRFTNTTYWRKQPRDGPKGRRSRTLDYLPEEGTRAFIPTVMALYWKTSANLYRLNHWSVSRGFDESKIS